MFINAGSIKSLYTGFKTIFNQAFAAETPLWMKVATETKSSTGMETYAWLGHMPGLREWIGDRVIHALAAHGYTIKNKPFESTVGVPRDAIEDDQYGVFGPLISEMGRSSAVHPDVLCFGLLTKGFEQLCYDGQPFFDTDHEMEVGGETVSVSNVQAGGSAPWFLLDTSRAIKPLIYQKRRAYKFVSMTNDRDTNVFMQNQFLYGVDGRSNAGYGFWQMAFASKAELNEANFVAAHQAMTALKRPNGEGLGIRPNLLVVGSTNEFKARELLLKERKANGESNTLQGLVDHIVSKHLE